MTFTLTPHELQLCGDAAGIEHLPVVLGRGPQSPDVDSWTASMAAARAGLEARGLLDPAGRMPDELEALLDTLGNPQHEIAARRIGEAGMSRLCLATGRRGDKMSALRQPGDDSAINVGSIESRAASLRGFLGEHTPADLSPANARLSEVQEGLAAAEGFAGCAHALERCEIASAAAALLAEVLTTATAFTEIVAIAHRAGRASDTPAAMVVYDSPAGRVVATPHAAPDGELWVAFAPGSWDRVQRGLRALDALITV